MSTGQVAVIYPAPKTRPAPEEMGAVQRLAERLTPKEGWDTFVMMVATVIVVAWSVREADWVDMPGLLPLVVLASLTGLILAKLRAPWPVLHLAGIAIGFVLVIWLASSLTENQPFFDQLREMWDRLDVWYEKASTGGISTDLLPFSIALLALGWLLGYFSAWFLFRITNPWFGLVLAGLAILTNLSFLPPGHESRFFLFMFMALLLVARVSIVQRQEYWRKSNIVFRQGSGGLAVRVIAGLSAAVLVVAALLPLKVYVSRTMVDIWNVGRTPISGLEDEFARLFSGISSRKNLSGRFFGETLPFLGKISFGGEIVMWATSEYPSYWLSRTYSQYTSEGWIAGKTTSHEVGKQSLPPPPQESFRRIPVYQELQLNFDSDRLLSGGNLDWVDRDAVVETLAPLEFNIQVDNASADAELPEDVRALAAKLREVLSEPGSGFIESRISNMLPDDLVLVTLPKGAKDGSRIKEITLARKEPSLPDVVSWSFAKRLEAPGTYLMRTYVSEATNDELRSAESDYSGFIKDHYLQLPESLPARVRELAAEITQESETALDKALAIQTFLRGGTFTYSQDIEKPPIGADGVDHFLFETQTGYSDYFASAMTVMLRSVGVPARLAAGYAPGRPEDVTGRRAVRDSDSHGWVQTYFPGHGWINFEPTPNWAPINRAEAGESATDLRVEEQSVRDPGEDLSECLDPEEFLSLEECLEEQFRNDDMSSTLQPRGFDPTDYAKPVGVAVTTVAALALIIWGVWTRGLSDTTQAERLYIKMSRLGTLAGIGRRPGQTPVEYATAIGARLPVVEAGARSVAWAFAAERYGNPRSAEQASEEDKDLNAAWKKVRNTLLGRILRRLAPVGI